MSALAGVAGSQAPHPAWGWLWLLPFVLLGLYFWIKLLGFALARLGGWAAWARTYRAEQGPAGGVAYGRQSGRFGVLGSYDHCLSVTLTRAGLHLAAARFFRRSHPPLLVPWQRLESVGPRRFFRRELALVFAGPAGRTLFVSLPEAAWPDLKEMSGRVDLFGLPAR